MKIKSITIYCSSSSQVSSIYFSAIQGLARGLVQAGHSIVYGGGNLGLMGQLAQTGLEMGGEVIGVIPESFNRSEFHVEGLSELIVTKDLFERKKKLIEKGDVLLAFPGGLGTLDELTEVMALKQSKAIEKPLILFNFLDFWRPLMDYLEELRERKMVVGSLDQFYTILDNTEDVLKYVTELDSSPYFS